MLNGRIYRAAFLPLLFALVIAGFSLTGRTAPLSSNLAPEAFEGARAFATLQGLARQFPERRPGSAGDQRLAAYLTQALRGLGSAAKGGFAVSTRAVKAQTIEGQRTLTTVIAQRPGTTGEAPIVILAHRDAAGRGAEAQLSATAALLELARVLAAGETQRTIVLVSTSGGSGGNGGAEDFAAHASEILGGRFDAALVLGDLAGTRASGPQVASFSDSAGSAPALLQSTVAAAVAQQAGGTTGAPGTLAALAHLVFPLTGGEQGPLGARGLPAVLVGVGGELPPPAGEPVSAARLEALGRAALTAVYALDGGPEIGGGEADRGLETGLPIQQKAIPAWALRLLMAALLLPALAVLGDGFARVRRRRGADRALGGRGRWRARFRSSHARPSRCCWARSARSPRRARRSPRRRCRSTATPWRRCWRARSCWCWPGWRGRRCCAGSHSRCVRAATPRRSGCCSCSAASRWWCGCSIRSPRCCSCQP